MTEQNNIQKASVKGTLTLLDIAEIKESNDEIYIKFTTELEWTEPRAAYHNLKLYRNSLKKVDYSPLWIPKLIFRNNKYNEDTRLASDKSNFWIDRKRNFSRSTLDTVEEIDIFKGSENPITMFQSYTKEFKCMFSLQVFSFDTQVCFISLEVEEADRWAIELTSGEARIETNMELTEYFITDNTKSPTLHMNKDRTGIHMKLIFKR